MNKNLTIERTCFIYYLINQVNGKKYIGMTLDLKRRKEEHIRDLRNNKHLNKLLQKDFNTYGEESFYFKLVSETKGVVGFHSYTIERKFLKENLIENFDYNIVGVAKNKEKRKSVSVSLFESEATNLYKLVKFEGTTASEWIKEAINEKLQREGKKIN